MRIHDDCCWNQQRSVQKSLLSLLSLGVVLCLLDCGIPSLAELSSCGAFCSSFVGFFFGVGYLGTWKSRMWFCKFRNSRNSEEFHLWRFQFWRGRSDQSTDCTQRKGTLYCASKTGWWEAPLLVYCSWPQILYWQLQQIQLHWSSQLLPQPWQVHMDHSACSIDPLIFKIAWKNHNQLEIY